MITAIKAIIVVLLVLVLKRDEVAVISVRF
jgi:hypothetical protein